MISKFIPKIDDRYGLAQYDDGTEGAFVFVESHSEGTSFEILNSVTCREEFSYDFNFQDKFIGFKSRGISIEKLNKFFTIIENKLKLRTKTVFFNTEIKNFVIIKMSKFWKRDELTLGFFSLFLRAGAAFYRRRTFEKTFGAYYLSRDIRPAINKFLKGYTKLSPKYELHDYGIVATFGGYQNEYGYYHKVSPQDIHKMLVKR